MPRHGVPLRPVASKGNPLRPYGWNAGDRLRRIQLGVNHHGHHSVTHHEPRIGDPSDSAGRSTCLLWGTRIGRYERLLRARCGGEVRGRHGMRVWVARGDAAQEVGVLRVTLSLVVAAGCDELRSRLRDEAREGSGSQNRCLRKARSCARSRGRHVSTARDWPEKWTPAHASKAACANQLPAWLSAKRTAAFGSTRRTLGSSPFGGDLDGWQGQFQGQSRGQSAAA